MPILDNRINSVNNQSSCSLKSSTSELEEDSKRILLETALLKSIEEGERDSLDLILKNQDSSLVLQALLTLQIPNHDRKFYYDGEVLQDALELLGNHH